jgi:hypothetical protein
MSFKTKRKTDAEGTRTYLSQETPKWLQIWLDYAGGATPSIDIWWKPTVFRGLYVASRITLRKASLGLRPAQAR